MLWKAELCLIVNDDQLSFTLLTEAQLHLVCVFFILGSALVPLYLSAMLKGNIRRLTLLLSVFVLIHAGYHVAGSLGMDFLSESIFEPASIAALISFGLYYMHLVNQSGRVVKNG